MRIGSDAHWILKGKLLAMRAPRGPDELHELAEAGVTDVLSLVPGGPEDRWSSEAGIRFAERPMPEMGSPSPEELGPAVDHMRTVLGTQGTCLAVHCHAGVGRAGVVAAVFLAAAAGLPPEQAIAEVRARRPGAVGSQDKEAAVEEFVERFRRGEVMVHGSRRCPSCSARVLSPTEVCFGCSHLPTLEEFFERPRGRKQAG